jgi:hypothetical protein
MHVLNQNNRTLISIIGTEACLVSLVLDINNQTSNPILLFKSNRNQNLKSLCFSIS